VTDPNCGDWVENCSALVEHFDGTLEILHVGRDGIAAFRRPEILEEVTA
jgi:hypothetical protein